MTDINPNALSLDDLKTLQKSVGKAIAGFETRKMKEARVAVAAKALEMGFTLEQLTGNTGGSKTKSAAPAKYRHPENPELT